MEDVGLAPRRRDLTGERFNRWLVLSLGEPYVYPSTGKKTTRWLCRCDCGAEKLVHFAHLKDGTSQSCGCLNWEISTTHGLSSTRAYKSWGSMLDRCNNPQEKDQPHYKGRGISVCERWLDVVNFFEDMGECPEGFELERIDYNKGYFPGNCIWADEQTQAENRGKFSNNTSGKTGVVWSAPHNKWRVYLNHKKIKYEGGLHETFESAVAKRKQLEIQVLGYEKVH